jgi:glycine/betaine/sarcosine/D-proline reductase family selenoprotein B
MNPSASSAARSRPGPPIPYLQRVREYYLALGYGAPYEWARVAEVPLQRLPRPLASCRVAIITTAALRHAHKGEQRPGAPYSAQAKFYRVYSGATDVDPELSIAHVAIDRVHTSGADLGSFFPLRALRDAAASGRTGALAARFHGLPTNRSQRTTTQVDAPELVQRCLDDAVDAVLLVANCPVCHQCVALAANQLEARGIASVVMGCAKDIVEHIGVPRFVFSDFPLGNAAGRPNDRESQRSTLELALRLLESATEPRCTVQSPLRWSASDAWKLDYCNVERLSAQEIAQRRAEFDLAKAQARLLREG